MTETLDPAEIEAIELLLRKREILNHRLPPEIDALLDVIDAQNAAERLVEQARLRRQPIYVCFCGEIFRDGKPTRCPKCWKEFRGGDGSPR